MKPADRQDIEAFLDDELGVEALARFADRVRSDADFADEVATAISMHGGIRAATSGDVDGIELQTRVELALGPDGRACPFTDEVMQRLDPPIVKPRRHLRRVLIFAAPLWVAALLALAFFIGVASQRPNTVAAIEAFAPGAQLTRNAQQRPLTGKDNLQEGDWLWIPEGGSLTARLDDDSRVRLAGGTRIQIAGASGNHLVLKSGKVTADVTPRTPDKALIIQSDFGLATVIGTSLQLSATDALAELVVDHGIVKLSANGKELLVRDGERGLLRPGSPPILIDPRIRAAAESAPTSAMQLFRTDETSVLLRFGPDTFAEAIPTDVQAHPNDWLRHCLAAGVDRVLIEAWNTEGFRLYDGGFATTAAESQWLEQFGDLVRQTAEACRAAKLSFGIACPLTTPEQAEQLLREVLTQNLPVDEIHFTDVGHQDVRFSDWRALVQPLAPDAAVTMERSSRFGGSAVTTAPIGNRVRVSLEGKNCLLMLSEVMVVADGANVALNRPAKQSSTGWGGDPQRAVDGNNDPRYTSKTTSHTDYDVNPWWEVTLDHDYLIDELQIWSRMDAHTDANRTYRVEIYDSRDRLTWSGWLDSLGRRSVAANFANGDAWQPARPHHAFRDARYYLPAADAKLIGGRALFQAALADRASGLLPLLCIAPDRDGRIPSYELESLLHYRALWRMTLERPVSDSANTSIDASPAAANTLLDDHGDTSWQALPWTSDSVIDVRLPDARRSNAILLRTPQTLGSRFATAQVLLHVDGKWRQGPETLLTGDHLLRFDDARVDQIRLRLLHAPYAPALAQATLLDLP